MDLVKYYTLMGAGSGSGICSVLASQNIFVPRFRGWDWMGEMPPRTKEQIEETIHENNVLDADRVLVTDERGVYTCGRNKRFEALKFKKDDWSPYDFDLNLIHGKKRKEVKFRCKNNKKYVNLWAEKWNEYAGRKDVLHITARMGSKGCGLPEYKKEWDAVLAHPDYLFSIDKWWGYDRSYCDIYFKIHEENISIVKEDGRKEHEEF